MDEHTKTDGFANIILHALSVVVTRLKTLLCNGVFLCSFIIRINFNIQHGASRSLFVSAVIAETKLKVAEIDLYLVSLLPELTICSAPRFSYHIQFINSVAQQADSR